MGHEGGQREGWAHRWVVQTMHCVGVRRGRRLRHGGRLVQWCGGLLRRWGLIIAAGGALLFHQWHVQGLGLDFRGMSLLFGQHPCRVWMHEKIA